METVEFPLKALLRGLRGPLFDGKYVAYLRFKKEWCAHRRTYHAHVRDKPASQTLKEKSLAPSAKALVGDVEDLSRVWTPWILAMKGQRSTYLRPWNPSSSSGSIGYSNTSLFENSNLFLGVL